MQITIKEAKVVKTGTSKGGDWELIRITSEDKTEYTTFDRKAKLPSGSVIEFELIIKEGKLSFKDCTIISEAAPKANGSEMSKGDWTDKQRIERESIESQVAAKLVVELRIAGAIDDKHVLYEAVLAWCSGKLKTDTVQKAEQTSEQIQGTATTYHPENVLPDTIPGSVLETDFDPVWLIDSLKQAKWQDATVKSYLKNLYQVADTTGTVVEVVARLSREDREKFFAVIQSELDKRKLL